MSQCPSCHKELDIRPQHHGTLYTCSQCNAVFFVNWDGIPELADHDHSEPVVEGEHFQPNDESPLQEAQAEQEPVANDFGFQPQIESYESLNSGLQSYESAQENNGESEGFSGETVEEFEASDSPDFEAELPSIDTPLDGHFGLESNNRAEQRASPLSAGEFMADVVEFANSEAPLEGFSYSIVVSGIDSKKQMELVEEVLLDPRLAIDVSDVLQSIQSGTLKLEKLNAAKAFILVERLQHISFNVEWSQNV